MTERYDAAPMMYLSRGCFTLLLAVAAGCFHVTLDPVPPAASFEQRATAYRRLRPAAHNVELVVTGNRYGVSVREESTLALADGTTVRHADDLLPVIESASPAARAAERSGSARQMKWTMFVGSVVAATAGTWLMLESIDRDFEQEGSGGGMMYSGIGLFTAGTIMALVGQFYYQRVEHSERRSAFATYEESLRGSLRLCVNGMQLVDCHASTPGLPAAPPPGMSPPVETPPAGPPGMTPSSADVPIP
jgi:hypothetical protein